MTGQELNQEIERIFVKIYIMQAMMRSYGDISLDSKVAELWGEWLEKAKPFLEQEHRSPMDADVFCACVEMFQKVRFNKKRKQ